MHGSTATKTFLMKLNQIKIKWIVEMFESRLAAISDIDRQRILDLLQRQQIWKLLKDTITGSVKLLERYLSPFQQQCDKCLKWLKTNT